MSRAWWFAAGFALCTSAACESEVTVDLLKNAALSSTDGAAGSRDLSQAGEAGALAEAGTGDDTSSSAGDSSFSGGSSGEANESGGEAGSAPAAPCQKLGPEVCNGGDDDCNGVIDDGCAYTIEWKVEPDSTPLGHDTGGVTFLEPCPDGSVLTGLRVGFGSWLNQVAAICRQIELKADTSQSPVSFSAALGARFDTPLAPAASTDAKNQLQDLLCPDGLILSAVDGTTSTDTARYIFGIRITCAPPIINSTFASQPVLDSNRMQEQSAGPLVCVSCGATPAYNFNTAIPTGRVAARLFGGDGLWVDRVGFGASMASVKAR